MESKKRNIMILAGVIVVIIIALLVFSTMSVQSELVVVDGTIIPQDICKAKGISDKVIVIHSPGCSACRKAVPILEEIENEINTEFEFIDISNDGGRIDELGLMPTKIPTVIIKCKTYVGVKTKEEFKALIEG